MSCVIAQLKLKIPITFLVRLFSSVLFFVSRSSRLSSRQRAYEMAVTGIFSDKWKHGRLQWVFFFRWLGCEYWIYCRTGRWWWSWNNRWSNSIDHQSSSPSIIVICKSTNGSLCTVSVRCCFEPRLLKLLHKFYNIFLGN